MESYLVLMGANTYRLMYSFPKEGEPGTDVLGGMSKVVFSNTLNDPLEWENSTLVTGDAVEAVRKMRENGDRSMRTMGSLTLSLADRTYRRSRDAREATRRNGAQRGRSMPRHPRPASGSLAPPRLSFA